ncbi:response regulator transcription factor [Leucothrix sargassi]|nr:response regulator transcription factor [Leucothrix sargassi]
MPSEVGGCLIIVDSDMLFINEVSLMFPKSVSIFVATTQQASLNMLREYGDQKLLVLCDVDLVKGDELLLCELIKREAPHAFLVLTNSGLSSALRMSALGAGVDMFLDKSVGEKELTLVLSNLSRTLLEEHESPSLTHVDTIFSDIEEDVRRYVENYYYKLEPHQRIGQQCTSESVAAALGLTIRTFQRAIKESSGYSFKQLQLVVRLEVAQRLFAEGYNVNQVSDFLAFSSPSHFSRSFKEEFGIAPSAYRRQL